MSDPRLRRRVREWIASHSSQFAAIVAVVGIVAVLVAAYFGPVSEGRLEKAALKSAEVLGTGLVASALVGLLVDQVTRVALARETAESWLWVLLGQDTPETIRTHLKQLLDRAHTLTLEADVVCDLSWLGDDAERRVRLAVTSRVWQVNHARRRSYLPTTRTWAMPSIAPHTTRFTGWSYEVTARGDESAPRRLKVSQALLDAHTRSEAASPAVYQPGETVVLEQGDMVAEAAAEAGIPLHSLEARQGEKYRMRRSFELILAENAFFPYVVTHPTAKIVFTFGGDALPDLQFAARSTTGELQTESTAHGPRFDPGPLLPGQGIFFSWSRPPASPAAP